MAYSIDLSGQVAIVTGRETGIGYGIATNFANAGAKVAIFGLSEPETTNEAMDKLRDLGTEVLYKKLDIGIKGNGTKLVQYTVEHFGRADIVVNNAGTPDTDWESAFSVNVAAPLEIIEEAAKSMKKKKYGRIVNITSSATFSGGMNIPYYGATKGALDAMTRFLAKKFAPDGILINAVAPGPVLTKLIQSRYTPEEFAAHYISQMPIGRYLVPDDIAGPVLFLCSELCSSVCGQTLLCDGGRVTLSVK